MCEAGPSTAAVRLLESAGCMANAKIEIVGPNEIELICRLYNEVFRPPQSAEYFTERLRGRKNLLLVAELDRQPVGFAVGYELRHSTYYSWLIGVLADARRLGIASQLLAAEQAWAKEHGYEMMRFECFNHHRPMLILAIRMGYDVVGIRWDARAMGNLVIFEKYLVDLHEA